jgi:hypothetical protein
MNQELVKNLVPYFKMKILLALLLLIPSLSLGYEHNNWQPSSLNLTQVLQLEEVEIVHIEKIREGDHLADIWMYHLRDVKQFYICNLKVFREVPIGSQCWYENW